MGVTKTSQRRGGSVIELSLMMPWILFLFVGAFDWGFYAHALISTESAARVAVIYAANASGGNVSSSTVCSLALDELKIVANVSGLVSCSGTLNDSQPVVVSATCPAPTSSLGNLNTVRISVAYRTLQLIPIPGLLAGKINLYRVVQMPMKGNATCTIV